jgi:ADP-ribosyl-[dinitrogen reductase] hydrolase
MTWRIGGVALSCRMTRWEHAFLGSLAADALAMPMHGYYDRKALRRDYGMIEEYLSPRNPHPDSVLGRVQYAPPNEDGDILHDQAVYWGQEGIHYHQFLEAGENTLSFRLAGELYRLVRHFGGYDTDAWLEHYIRCMRTRGWHRDTYVEACHRGFFTRYAQGSPPRECGIEDRHIGGLAQVPALLAALGPVDVLTRRSLVREHVALTHGHAEVLRAADAFTGILNAVVGGAHPRVAIERESEGWFSAAQAAAWSRLMDDVVVGEELSLGGDITDAFPAALYFAWKYAEDFTEGIIANAMAGGDNCHRGAVVGAILGAANAVPGRWIAGLRTSEIIEAEA